MHLTSSSGVWNGGSTPSVCCLHLLRLTALAPTCVRELDEEESAYRVKADYLTPVRAAELRELRGDDRSYVTESRSVRLPAFDSTCAIAVSSGRKVVLPAAQLLVRRELAEEFNIAEVTYVPCLSGVLEYGVATPSEMGKRLLATPKPREKRGFMQRLAERRSKESWSTPGTPATSNHGGGVFDSFGKAPAPAAAQAPAGSRSDKSVLSLALDVEVTRILESQKNDERSEDDDLCTDSRATPEERSNKDVLWGTRGEGMGGGGAGSSSFSKVRLPGSGRGLKQLSLVGAPGEEAVSITAERKKSLHNGGNGRPKSFAVDHARQKSLRPDAARQKSIRPNTNPLIAPIPSTTSLSGMPTSRVGGAPRGVSDGASRKQSNQEHTEDYGDILKQSFRFDLDDLNGEVVLLRWGDFKKPEEEGEDSTNAEQSGGADAGRGLGQEEVDGQGGGMLARAKGNDVTSTLMRYGPNLSKRLTITSHVEGKVNAKFSSPLRRLLQLDGNRFVSALPPPARDPVGQDLKDLPRVLSKILSDWDQPSDSLNRMSAWTFSSLLKERMKLHDDHAHDGSVDLLITGCEVSLWVAEQFAADLHRIFPVLKIVTISANKLLVSTSGTEPAPLAATC